MAQLHTRPTGGQVVAGSFPPCWQTFFHDLYEIFSMVIVSLLLIQEGQLSVYWQNYENLSLKVEGPGI